MNQRKTGTLPLCCMMIGAVLGSGIVILPPLVRGMAAGGVQVTCTLLLTTGLRTMSRVGTLLAVTATLLLLTGPLVTLAVLTAIVCLGLITTVRARQTAKRPAPSQAGQAPS